MARLIAWELEVFGSYGMTAAVYPGMLALIESGALDPQKIITHVIGLDRAAGLLPLRHCERGGHDNDSILRGDTSAGGKAPCCWGSCCPSVAVLDGLISQCSV